MKKIGFTLIELLIVITLIGILSMISYPIYNKHLTKARRTYAMVALLDLAGRMEEYYSSKNSYNDASLENLNINNLNYKNFYKLTITSKNDTYILQAIPLEKQNNNDTLCGALSLDQNGNKYISGFGTIEECWY